MARIGALPSPSLLDWDSSALAALFPSAMAIAAPETLLTARVVDGMVEGVPPTHANRELVGQGLANVASGARRMPATGAIARTAVNVRGRTHARGRRRPRGGHPSRGARRNSDRRAHPAALLHEHIAIYRFHGAMFFGGPSSSWMR